MPNTLTVARTGSPEVFHWRVADIAVTAALALMLAGCGGNKPSEDADSSSPSSASATTMDAVRGGDAATNPACALVDAADIRKIVPAGEKLIEIHGTTTEGEFTAASHNCFWITDGAAPWVLQVTLEEDLGPKRDEAIASVQESIRVGADQHAGLGDLAATIPPTVRLIAGQRYLMVQVEAADSGKDVNTAMEQAIELARKALSN